MNRLWKVTCKEDRYPGIWQRWFKNQCVAVGWPPNDGYKLDGKSEGDKGWSTARNAIKKMEIGDFVIIALKGNMISRMGKIIGKAIEDSEWDPTVPKNKNLPTGELGRRILVRWNLLTGPDDTDMVIKLPENMKFSNGELRPTVSEIKTHDFISLKNVIDEPSNWVSLLGKFAYEQAISDYIANFPHHLEDGLTVYPDSKIREKVFPDRSRVDVLLIDKDEIPVVVECKQGSPTVNDVGQLRNYMNNILGELGKKPRGILVHGGSQKLNPLVHDLVKDIEDIEIMSYKIDIDFKRSS
jgi:hypothetical protein